MIRADARVRVVLVNYNGGELLERAVLSALNSQWPGPIDVIVVDNASSDDSLAAVAELGAVTVIQTGSNEGFAANNRGIADLIGGDHQIDLPAPDVVALLNPDAFLRPDSLRLLAGALNADKLIGAASPTIVFDRPFLECLIETPSKHLVVDRIESGERDLSAQCHGIDGAERLPGADGPVWLCPNGSTLRVPVSSANERIVFHVSQGMGTIDGVDLSDSSAARIDALMRRSHRVVQNAGIFVDGFGNGHNHAFGTRVEDLNGTSGPLWCGAAVCFHADYLRDVGGFDERYFLYYEDVDLALRGLAQGWNTVYVPDAIVEHRHSDQTVQGSELVEVLQHKNRLLTQVRHGSTGEVVKSFGRAALTPMSLAASAVRSPGERKERLRLASWRAKALRDAVKGLPEARKVRSSIDEERQIDADEVRRVARKSRSGRNPKK